MSFLIKYINEHFFFIKKLLVKRKFLNKVSFKYICNIIVADFACRIKNALKTEKLYKL